MRSANATLLVIVLGLFGIVALPGRAPVDAPEATLWALRVHQQAFQAAIEAYAIDHGRWPGWEPCEALDGAHGPVAEASWLEQQLCRPTDPEGIALPQRGLPGALGPYLEGGLPVNPWNGLASVRVLGEGGVVEIAAAGQHGWIYDPRWGRVWPDLPARLAAFLPSGPPTFHPAGLPGSSVGYFEQ